jgi:NAD-dependent dihydropyrimidine dehydrogenase PreA subunit
MVPWFVASYGENMAIVSIERSGCRSCSLCQEICPTHVFEMGSDPVPVVAHPENCIGCESCRNLCPSRCLEVADIAKQRPFYRIEENVAFVGKFLRATPVAAQIPEGDWDEALKDVGVRLDGLAESIVETMGRGQKAVGRKAGKLSAEHLPEMYEGHGLSEVLTRLQHRLRGAFEFDSKASDDGRAVTLSMKKCALVRVCQQAGRTPASAVVCQLLHEYLAGLLGTFVNINYSVTMDEAKCPCTITLSVRD